MPWTPTNKIHHLAQLHEESRYYRRFHHTLLSVTMAGYIGLLILQANLLTSTINISIGWNSITIATMGIALIVLVIAPVVLTYLFVTYHFVQGFIRDNIRAIQEELGFPDRYLEDKKYKDFRVKPKRQKFCIGRGHIMFIILLWLMVLANGGIFFILLKGITQG